MEQATYLFGYRIHPSDIGSFEGVAGKTRQTEVVGSGLTFMLLRNYVVEFMRQKRYGLG